MPDLQNGQEPVEVIKPTITPADAAAQAKAAAAGDAPAKVETPAAPAADAPKEPAVEAPAADEADKGASDGDTPDWKKKQEESANREAASYRIKLREAEAEIERLKPLDTRIAELTDKLTVAQVALERATVLAAHGIPADLAENVTGNTVEEMTASAERLAKFIVPAGVVRPEPKRGGLDPFNGAEPISASDAYKQAKGLR